MIESANAFVQLSQALIGHSAEAARLVAAVRIPSHRHITCMLWQPDAVVTSEQSLPKEQAREQECAVVLPGGKVVPAKIAGRDPGTNLAELPGSWTQIALGAPWSYA